MASITINIPNAKLQRVRTGMLEVYPNTETIPDPDWIDPGDGSRAPQIPKYTDNQWLKELVRRYIVQTVRRAESKIAQEAARAALTETDTLAS